MNGAIVAHTNLVTAELARRCAEDPTSELAAWIRIAEQREAMVVALYGKAAVAERLPHGTPEVVEVVAKAVASIWAQEDSHTRLMGALRTVAEGSRSPVEALLGQIEGVVTHHATTSRWSGAVARWLISLGRLTGAAPEFTAELKAMPFVSFCRFSNELEQTAAHGYARIITLLSKLQDLDALEPSGPDRSIQFGLWTHYEIAKTLAEERLHAAVFDHVIGWLSRDGERFVREDPRRCVQELRKLAEDHLAIARVRELPAPVRQLPEATPGPDGWRGPPPSAWVSDGGLGDILRAYAFDVPLVDAEQMHEALRGPA
jgi:hypothetical protein